MALKYADCDGHVMEDASELVKYVGEPLKTTIKKVIRVTCSGR